MNLLQEVADSKIDPSSCREANKKLSLTQILRNKKRGRETPLTGNLEIDEIVQAIYRGPDIFDFVVRDEEGNEKYRFYFLGTHNEKIVPGRKIAQNLVHRACPECGKQTPVIVIIKKEEFIGRTTGEKIKGFRLRRATIHCGKLQIFKD